MPEKNRNPHEHGLNQDGRSASANAGRRYVSGSRATMPNQGERTGSRATMPNQGEITNSRATMPNQGEITNSRATTPNQGEITNSRATMPNQGEITNSRATTPNQGEQYGGENAHGEEGALGKNPFQENASSDAVIEPGMMIDGFTVVELIRKHSGEARLYKCLDAEQNEHVLKLFEREFSDDDIERHNSLVQKLKTIKQGVVNIKATGFYKGNLYEIMPYYQAGSLKDRMEKKLFSEGEIEQDILPQMLQILKSIHDAKIWHCDIKPENIMYKTARRKELVLIDFGVSRVTQSGRTTYVQIQGGTPDYQAPEMFRGVLWEGTDYFALGITIFALLTGQTPTAYNVGRNEVEFQTITSAVPKMDSMSNEMYKLIYYLTYDSIRNRDDRSNFNNRWLYNETHQWLEDYCPNWPDPVPVAGEIPINVRFGERRQVYETMDELIYAMGADWERARSFVRREDGGLVSELARSANRDSRLMSLRKSVEEFVKNGNTARLSEDIMLFSFIYQPGRDIQEIFWKGNMYSSLDELGQAIFQSLSHGDVDTFFDFLKENMLGMYFEQRVSYTQEERRKIDRMNQLANEYTFSKNDLYTMYLAAYILMDEKRFYLDNDYSLLTPGELKAYLSKEGKSAKLLDMIKFCGNFVYDSGAIKESYRAWSDVREFVDADEDQVEEELHKLPALVYKRPNALQPSAGQHTGGMTRISTKDSRHRGRRGRS